MCYYLLAYDELFNPESLQLKVTGAGHKRQDSGYVFRLHSLHSWINGIWCKVRQFFSLLLSTHLVKARGLCIEDIVAV